MTKPHGKPIHDPISMLVKANEAFLESIYSSTPGVVNLVQELRGTESDGRKAFSDIIGTASAIRWRGREMLITAGHVISGATADQLAFLTRPSGSIGTVTKHGAPGTVRHSLPVTKVFSCSWEDLAVLELGKLPSDVKLWFTDIDEHEQAPPPGTQILAIGYPASSAILVNSSRNGLREERALGVTPDLVDGDVEDPGSNAESLGGFDPEAHILVTFHPSRSQEKAPGFSGTGLWYFKQQQSREQIWYARPRLAGVCTHQYEVGKLLRGVRAEVVVKFLIEIS